METTKADAATKGLNKTLAKQAGLGSMLTGQIGKLVAGYSAMGTVRFMLQEITMEIERQVDATRRQQEALTALKALDPRMSRQDEGLAKELALISGIGIESFGPAMQLLRSGTSSLDRGTQDNLLRQVAETMILDPGGDVNALAELFGTFSSMTGIQDAGQIQNLLGATGINAKTTFSRMSSQLPRVLGIALEAGATPAEALQLFSAFTQGAGSTGNAVTGMGAFIAGLNDPSPEFAKRRSNLGIESGMDPMSAMLHLQRRTMTTAEVLGFGREAAMGGLATVVAEPRLLHGARQFIGAAEHGGDFIGQRINRLSVNDPGFAAELRARRSIVARDIEDMDPEMSDAAALRLNLETLERGRGVGVVGRTMGRLGSKFIEIAGGGLGAQADFQTGGFGFGTETVSDQEIIQIIQGGVVVQNGGLYNASDFANEDERDNGGRVNNPRE